MTKSTNDYDKVRRLRTCLCGDAKDEGLILCWPCHRREKRFNDGGYSAETLELLDTLEERA